MIFSYLLPDGSNPAPIHDTFSHFILFQLKFCCFKRLHICFTKRNDT